MLKRALFIAITSLLFLTSTFVQQSTVSAQGNTKSKLNENVAAVEWTGYNDREDFQQSPSFMRKLFCSADGAFRVKSNHYFTIRMNAPFPSGFAKKFKEAVDKIKDKKKPTLIVALVSHGTPGIICRQTKNDLNYDDLLDILFKNSVEVNKDITIILFDAACHSGSIIPIIQKKLSCNSSKEDCAFEGTDSFHYKYKISLYAAAPSDKVAWNTEFLDALNLVSKQEECKDKESCGLNDKGVLTFLLTKSLKHYLVFWSSFQNTSSIDILVSTLKNDKNQDYERASAADALGVMVQKGDKTTINLLITTLKNDKEDNTVRASAAGALGIMILKGDKTVITALIDVLKNDKNDDPVRASAIDALGNTAREDRAAIETLIDALRNDKNAFIRHEAAGALGKIAPHGDKTVIDALCYAINIDPKNKNEQKDNISLTIERCVRKVAAGILGKIAYGDKTAIETLNYVLKNDKDKFVLDAVNEALKNITPTKENKTTNNN